MPFGWMFFYLVTMRFYLRLKCPNIWCSQCILQPVVALWKCAESSIDTTALLHTSRCAQTLRSYNALFRKQPLMEIQTLTIFSATSKQTQRRHWNVHAFLGTQNPAITQSPDPLVQWAVDYCRLTKSINLQRLHVSSALHSPVKPKQRSLWSFYLLIQSIIHVSIKFKPKHPLYAFIVYNKCLEIN